MKKLGHLSLLAGLLIPALAHADLGDRVTAALQAGSLLAFILVFFGGVLTSLTPCVYPLIPITLTIFGARGKDVGRGRAVLLALVYVNGMGLMYASLGTGVALTGHAFGTFMANPWVIAPIALIFVLMAASMFGAFEMNLPMGLQTRLSQVGGTGFGGAFVMGLVGGIIAAPCTGPVLASLLAYVATTRSVLFGASLLYVYALGMGLLFFILAATAASLPKSGAWMESVKSVFGVVMLLAAAYFARNIIKPLAHFGDWHPWFGELHAALLIVGVFIGGIHLSFHDAIGKRIRKALGLALAVYGGFGLIAWVLTPKPLEWVKGEPAARARAAAEKKPLLLDFSADWCLPCKELELQVFGTAEVQRELDRFVAGSVDLTEEDEAVAALREKYDAKTLPTVLLIGSDGTIAHRWKQPMTAEDFLREAQKVH